MNKCESCGVRWNVKPKNRTMCNDCERKMLGKIYDAIKELKAGE